VSATGSAGQPSTLRVSPLTLPDSAQIRLKRMYPAATYRATTATVQVPVPRTGSGIGAPRIRDLELAQMVADLVLALDGRPQGEVDITAVPEAAVGAGNQEGV
jgi:transcription-repair coupling factor (superfamily II helicase)